MALQSAGQALAALWGDPQLPYAEVQGGVAPVPTRGSVDTLIRPLDDAPGLVTSRIEIDRRRALVEVERSKGVPDLTVCVGAKRDNNISHTQAIVGVSMPLPFFDTIKAPVLKAARRVEKASDDHQATRIRLTSKLRQAANQLAVSDTTVQTLKASVLPAALQACDAATRGIEAGKFGFLDVIDAQRSLLQARARYLTALSSAHQAAVTIDRLLGR